MAETETETETEPAAPRKKGPTTVAREYFEAIDGRDLDAAAALWKPGGTDHLVGLADLRVPGELKQWFGNLFRAFPDFHLEVLTITTSRQNAAVRWRGTGTFNGTARFEGIAPNGASLELEGCDVLTIEDGQIVENFAYMNGTDLARQLGAMPPRGSIAERGLLGAVNARTAASGALERFRNR